MIRLTRRGLLALAATGGAIAGAGAASPAWADDAAAVRAPIVALYKGLEAVMKAGRATLFPRRFDILAPVVDQVFDLETVFLMPWAIVAKEFGGAGLAAAMFFVSVLVVGLIYEWRKGGLEWE